MEFEGGATATFSMCGFTRDQNRTVQIMGTKGEIRGNMKDNRLSVYDFLTDHETVIHLKKPVGGHGGGDQGIMRSFLNELNQKDKDRKSTRLNSSHVAISYAVFCLKKKNQEKNRIEGYITPPHISH